MRSILNNKLVAAMALLGLSSTAFADFGDTEARLYCQVTCKGVKGNFGRLAFDEHGKMRSILGSWSDTGFATNRAQYTESMRLCQQVYYDVVRSYPLRDRIRLGFLKENSCVVEPLAYSWYNPFISYKISVTEASE